MPWGAKSSSRKFVWRKNGHIAPGRGSCPGFVVVKLRIGLPVCLRASCVGSDSPFSAEYVTTKTSTNGRRQVPSGAFRFASEESEEGVSRAQRHQRQHETRNLAGALRRRLAGSGSEDSSEERVNDKGRSVDSESRSLAWVIHEASHLSRRLLIRPRVTPRND